MNIAPARPSVADAVNYLASGPASSTDRLGYWIFDNATAGPPSRSDVTGHLASRLDLIGVLNRRVAAVPGGIGSPVWVHDPTTLEDRLEFAEEPIGWDDLRDRMARAFGSPLDARECTWRMTVYPNVRDAPVDSRLSATVVVCQISHALLVGARMGDLSIALFGERPAALHVPGLGPALPRPRPAVCAASSAARLPLGRYLSMLGDAFGEVAAHLT